MNRSITDFLSSLICKRSLWPWYGILSVSAQAAETWMRVQICAIDCSRALVESMTQVWCTTASQGGFSLVRRARQKGLHRAQFLQSGVPHNDFHPLTQLVGSTSTVHESKQFAGRASWMKIVEWNLGFSYGCYSYHKGRRIGVRNIYEKRHHYHLHFTLTT